VELLGAERLVHARLGQETLTVRLDEAVAAPVPGQHFSASPRPECVHHFDLSTGLRFAS
jgi:sn-glycerol 3-phosphate transport system ATP-binding protein